MPRNTIASDVFPASIDANWNNGDGDWLPWAWVSSGIIQSATNATDLGLTRNSGAYPRAQWGMTTLAAAVGGGGDVISTASILMATGTNESAYHGALHAGTGAPSKYEIYETDATFGFTTLASTGTAAASYSAGTYIVTESDSVGGLTLFTSENGGAEASRLTASDTTIITGRPGISGGAFNSAATDYRVSAWSGGDFNVPPPAVTAQMNGRTIYVMP